MVRPVATRFSHFGICVSNLDASLHFYCDALGFAPAERHEVGTEFAALMELDGVAVTSQFIRREGLLVELLAFTTPAAVGERVRRPVNQFGLTHLNFRVDDVDEVAGRIRAMGGTVLDHTRTTFPPETGFDADFVYCTDPDGTRIELMRLPT
jgi:catechol 2,3-dioxygenase-like lactoylglutathione lyase family enzyme